MAYVKLAQEILDSTIWLESSDVRIVWITLLAMSNRDGEVAASLPGIARRAGVSLEITEIAMQKFMEPDPYSRTPDYEGRRIEPIPGGWQLLNFQKYRDYLSREDQKQKNAARQQRSRNRKKCDSNAPVTAKAQKVTHTLHIADPDPDTDPDPEKIQISEFLPKESASKPFGKLSQPWITRDPETQQQIADKGFRDWLKQSWNCEAPNVSQYLRKASRDSERNQDANALWSEYQASLETCQDRDPKEINWARDPRSREWEALWQQLGPADFVIQEVDPAKRRLKALYSDWRYNLQEAQ